MDDREKIKAGVQLYFEGMYESSAEKTREIFHENARVTGYLHGELVQMTAEEFAGFVASQQPSPKEKQDEVILEIVSCDIEGSTASVKVRDRYMNMNFIDTLSFIKIGERWKIYNKLFHVENG